MELILNGESYQHRGAGHVGSLLEEIGLNFAQAAVLVNDEVVRRDDFDATRLNDKDRIEILTYAGGG